MHGIAEAAVAKALIDLTDSRQVAIVADGSAASGEFRETSGRSLNRFNTIRFQFSSSGVINNDDFIEDEETVPCASGDQQLKCDNDGLGVNDDEISAGEWLDVELQASFLVCGTLSCSRTFKLDTTLLEFSVLDLFCGFDGCSVDELPRISVDGGDAFTPDLIGGVDSANGYARFGLPDLGSMSIIRFLTGEGPGASDYALASLSVRAAVPVPPAAVLLLTGLGGIAAARRRALSSAK